MKVLVDQLRESEAPLWLWEPDDQPLAFFVWNELQTLLFGFGNPLRGDDALGPLLIERLGEHPLPPGTVLLSSPQLLPEHLFELEGKGRVVFLDAGIATPSPFTFQKIEPEPRWDFTTHLLDPQGLLALYQELFSEPPPESFLLTLRGERFELGAPPTQAALARLSQALHFLLAWLKSRPPFPPRLAQGCCVSFEKAGGKRCTS